MEHETKITYGVIGGLIILLLGIAYMLQPKDMAPTETPKTTKEQTNKIVTPVTKATTTNQSSTTMETQNITSAVITTNKGVIEVEFSTNTPNTVKNFTTLASSSFYNGVRFHRVIKGFMIQGGDPLSKDVANKNSWGTGGPGYKFNDELTGKEQYTLGTLAMANAGPNTNGSQFFIVTAQPGVPLPPSYTVFGRVTKGIEVALAIENVKTNGSDQPLEDVVIEKVELK